MDKKYIFGHQRNFDNIQFADLRKTVDQEFNLIHDELSDCYYNYWKLGKSKSVDIDGIIYDKKETIEESKAQFDKLHGFIFNLREVKFHQENKKLPEKERILEDKYRYEKDEKGNILRDKIQEAQDKISNFRSK